jgi:photosystem II stability/assembly factor-like uncharacterized protein
VDSNNGWVGCDDDDYLGFFRTTDSGNTWMQTPKEVWPLGKGVQSFFFVDSLNGWLGTVPGVGGSAFIQTTDGGQTWRYLQEAKIDNVASLCFLNKNLGWAVGLNVDGVRESVILLYKK